MRVDLGLPSSALHLANLGLELEDRSQQHLPPTNKKLNIVQSTHLHAHIHTRAPINTHTYTHANEAKGGCEGRRQLTQTETETDVTEAYTGREKGRVSETDSQRAPQHLQVPDEGGCFHVAGLEISPEFLLLLGRQHVVLDRHVEELAGLARLVHARLGLGCLLVVHRIFGVERCVPRNLCALCA